MPNHYLTATEYLSRLLVGSASQEELLSQQWTECADKCGSIKLKTLVHTSLSLSWCVVQIVNNFYLVG